MDDILLFAPAVFAVGREYQIFIRVREKCTCAVLAGGERYYDDFCGVLRSDTAVHKVTVPMRALDEAGMYTVILRRVYKRLPYRSPLGPEKTFSFAFRPVPLSGHINICHIADTHGSIDHAVLSATGSGTRTDLLILNGDIFDSSDTEENFDVVYELAGRLTGGGIPMIFARGNHDLRGRAAERMGEYFPLSCGKTYYTFRLGGIWGIVLDCGEDKDDTNEEYGGCSVCHSFRLAETDFLERIASDPLGEYAAPGVDHRLVISHAPFTYTLSSPFDIEQELYSRWAALLRDKIKPDLMLCGHLHICDVCEPGGKFDSRGQPCTVVIGSQAAKNGRSFRSCAVTLGDGPARISFPEG